MVPIFRRLKLSPTLGFLGAGVILGPFGLGALQGELPWLRYVTIKNSAQMAQLAEFGVVFLLFAIGLELSWERLWTMRRLVFGLGGSQVVLCTAAIAGVAMLLGLDPVAAALLGSALALVVDGDRHAASGRTEAPVLAARTSRLFRAAAAGSCRGAYPRNHRSPRRPSRRGLLAQAPAGLRSCGARSARPRGTRPPHFASHDEVGRQSRQRRAVRGGIAAGRARRRPVAAVSGLSMALGAFIAGLLLAETEYRKEVEKTVEPFKGLLLGLFFVSVGIGLDLSLLAERPILIVGLLLGLLVLNGGIVFGLARLFGLRTAAAAETALLLAAGGEFAFVILHSAGREGLLDRQLVQTVLVSSTLSMFCIPVAGDDWRRDRPVGLAKHEARLARPQAATLGRRSWSSATAGWASSSPKC